MGNFGQEILESVGSGITITADGDPKAKAAGITVSWPSLAVFAKDAVFLDSDYVYAGERYIRYGTVMVKILTGTAAGQYVPFGTTVDGVVIALLSVGNVKGESYIMLASVHENDRASNFPAVIDGGRVYKSRLRIDGNTAPAYSDTTDIADPVMGSETLSVANFEAAFPNILYVTE